jgi:hypothetical protein
MTFSFIVSRRERAGNQNDRENFKLSAGKARDNGEK